MVIKSLLEGSMKGVGKYHKTPIFPCGIFQYMKGVNDKPGTPNYDLYRLALKSTSKRLYPNYCQTLWKTNSDGILQDRFIKTKVINSLSEEDYDKLIQFGLNNPKQFEQLGLTIETYD